MEYIMQLPRIAGCMALQAYNPQAPLKDLRGKVAVITGANSGIGYETARALARMGCTVYLCCRNQKNAEYAIRCLCMELKQMRLPCESALHFIQLDLADLNSVKRAADELKQSLSQAGRSIDYFINNAGIMYHPYAKSAQGYELHWATNHLGHFVWTISMMKELRNARSKVVVIADDVACLEKESSPRFIYSGEIGAVAAYCRSKIANICFGFELQQRFPELKVYVIHPGAVCSPKLLEYSANNAFFYLFANVLNAYVLLSPEQGCQSTLLCCLTEEVSSGSYFHNVYGESKANEFVYDSAARKQLWELTEKIMHDFESQSSSPMAPIEEEPNDE